MRMAPRDPHELHRASSPLELFLDLAFVVAVAQVAGALHHGLVDGHIGDALVGYPAVFFAIWWAWMNFTWFASAFDCDDVLYRLAVFVQMTGVLVLAAGVPRAFDDMDFTVMVVGYVIMRLAMVAQWLRAAVSYEAGRPAALRFAVGIGVLQVGWVLRLFVPGAPGMIAFLLLVAGELAVPVWAEGARATPWHPRHIAERYGLFTIIVLGESVLGATVAVQQAVDDADRTLGELAPVIVGGLLIVFSMWWIYFALPSERLVERAREDDGSQTAFAWGYGHFVVFASVAATGAGIVVAVDGATGESSLSSFGAGLAVTLPVAAYVLAVWLLHRGAKAHGVMRDVAPPIAVVAVLVMSVTPEPVLGSGLVMVALVAVGIASGEDRSGGGVAVPGDATAPGARRV